MNVDMIKFAQITSVSTGATAVATSRSELTNVNGYLEYIKIDLSGTATPDVDIDITTIAGTGNGAAVTLWSDDDITADVAAPVRQPAVNTANTAITNSGERIPLVNATVRVDAYDSDTSAANVDVWMFISS